MNLNENEFKSELSRVFKLNGVGGLLNAEKSDKFYRLTLRMLEENEKYNLTAIKEADKIILNHYADCALPAAKLKKGASIIDVGCGAGFPTLPFAILRDDIKILAIDSTAKKVAYVAESARLLGLQNVTALSVRAEDAANDEGYREKFDYATARAVANLQVLSELCLPFVKPGGEFIALKGKNAAYELNDAKRAIAILGGTDAKIEELKLTDGVICEEHPLITIKKKTKTPSIYPRPYAKILKKPL